MTTSKEAIMVRLDPTLKQRLREHAARQKCSMSVVVEKLVQTHFELADALDREDTPSEVHNLAIIMGEHQIPDFDVEES